MAEEVGKLTLQLRADISDLQRGLNQAVSGIQTLQNSVKETTRQTSAFSKVMQVAGGVAAGQVLYEGMRKATSATKGYVTSAIQAASRSEEMGFILETLGKRFGVGTGAINQQIETMKELGITTDVAQNTLAEFIRRQIDFTKASHLARVAQDLGRITNSNSSETLQELIYAIRTGNSQLTAMQELGVQTGDAMKRYASANNVAVESLTPLQREQAILNAILQAGAPNAGLYEASLNSAGKRAQSLERHFYELRKQLGDSLLPAFGAGVRVVEEWVLSLRDATEVGKPLRRTLDDIGKAIAERISQLVNFANQVGPVITNFVNRLRELDIGSLIGRNIQAIVGAFNALRVPLLEIGKSILPIVSAFLKALTPIVEAVSRAIQRIPVPVLTGALTAFLGWKFAIQPLQRVISILSGSAAATNSVQGLALAVSNFVLNIRTAPSLTAGLGAALRNVHPIAIAVGVAIAGITWQLSKLKSEAGVAIRSVEKGIRARTGDADQAILEVNKEIASREKLLKIASKQQRRALGKVFLSPIAFGKQAFQKDEDAKLLKNEIAALKTLKETFEVESDAARDAADAMNDFHFELPPIIDDLGDVATEAGKVRDFLDILREALDRTTGPFFRSADAASSYADSLDSMTTAAGFQLTEAQEGARRQREFESAVRGALQAIENQATALVESGRIGKDTGSVMSFIKSRVVDLKGALVSMASKTKQSFDDLERRLSTIRSSLDRHIGVYLDAVDATANFESAVFGLSDALNESQEMQEAIKDKLPFFDPVTKTWHEQTRAVREVSRATKDIRLQFTQVIRAIQQEALALAQVGAIGSDAASVHAFIRQRLQQLLPLFPQLSAEIQEYIDRLDAIPVEVETAFEIEMRKAIAAVEDYQFVLAKTPATIRTIVEAETRQANSNVSGFKQNYGGVGPIVEDTKEKLKIASTALAGLTTEQLRTSEAVVRTTREQSSWVENLSRNVGNFAQKIWDTLDRAVKEWSKPDSGLRKWGKLFFPGLIPHQGALVAHEGIRVPAFRGNDRLGRTGGIKRDERLALLQTGEGVLPRDVMRMLGSSQFEALRRGQLGVPDLKGLGKITVPMPAGGGITVHGGINVTLEGVSSNDPVELGKRIAGVVRNEFAKTARRNVTTGV